MDRLAFAWAVRGSDESEEHPVLFGLPDARAYARMPMPAVVDVELVAFAHSLSVSEDGHHPWGDLALAAAAYVPIGQFSDGSTEPEAIALFTGTVEMSERRLNRAGRKEFGVLVVRTLAFTLPVVVDLDVLQLPGSGASVMMEAWLSGRMPSAATFEDEPPRRPGFLNLLLGR